MTSCLTFRSVGVVKPPFHAGFEIFQSCSNHVTPIALKAACLAAFLFSLFKKVSDQVSDLIGHLILQIAFFGHGFSFLTEE